MVQLLQEPKLSGACRDAGLTWSLLLMGGETKREGAVAEHRGAIGLARRSALPSHAVPSSLAIRKAPVVHATLGQQQQLPAWVTLDQQLQPPIRAKGWGASQAANGQWQEPTPAAGPSQDAGTPNP